MGRARRTDGDAKAWGRPPRVWLRAALFALPLWSALPQTVAWSTPARPALRGITVGPIESSQQAGRGYGTAYSAELLDELVRLGANAIAITPFGRLWSTRSTQIQMDFELPYEENRAAVATMVAQAKARGLEVMLVPHLWIETAGWRGDIDPGSPERWAAYRASYRSFVLRWARDAAQAGVDIFSIGVECKSWSGRFGAYWRGLIEEVREVFPGRLTYSSNWDEVEGVLFWDQLDLLGINAFYPLADQNDATYATYAARAGEALDRAGEVAAILEMPVLLVEIGYTSRPNAAVEPWLWPDGMSDIYVDEWEQARALAAIAGAAASREWIAGFFVWRYYANLDDVSQEAPWGFSPHAKLAEPVLEAIFSVRWAAEPATPLWEPLQLAPREGGL